jgi:hypothetical protein
MTAGRPSSSAATNDVFAGVKSCDLLNTALASEGFNRGEEDDISTDNGCQASKPKFGSINLELDSKQGLDSFTKAGESAVVTQVNGRNAVQLAENTRCYVVVEVTSRSRATVLAGLRDEAGTDSCTYAKKVAEAVEPQLPKVN